MYDCTGLVVYAHCTGTQPHWILSWIELEEIDRDVCNRWANLCTLNVCAHQILNAVCKRVCVRDRNDNDYDADDVKQECVYRWCFVDIITYYKGAHSHTRSTCNATNFILYMIKKGGYKKKYAAIKIPRNIVYTTQILCDWNLNHKCTFSLPFFWNEP